MIKLPEMQEMLKKGVHFGHKKAKRYPKMDEFIYTTRSGINIIDLNKTVDYLKNALESAKKMSAEGKTILFIGTKKQAQRIIKKHALDCGMPFINNRWIGGTFTNFSVFKRNIKEYLNLKKKLESDELDKYTKKERIMFKRKMDCLEKMVGGLVSLDKLPNAIFIIDTKKDKIAVKEAVKINIPVFGICDTNSNPRNINWIIPANDDAVKSIDMIGGLMAEAIKEGKTIKEKNA